MHTQMLNVDGAMTSVDTMQMGTGLTGSAGVCWDFTLWLGNSGMLMSIRLSGNKVKSPAGDLRLNRSASILLFREFYLKKNKKKTLTAECWKSTKQANSISSKCFASKSLSWHAAGESLITII